MYIETSVWNFYFADDAPDKRDKTIEFFDKLGQGKNEIFISEVVNSEIERATPEKKQQLNSLMNSYTPVTVRLSEQAVALASQYIAQLVLPAGSLEDAFHAAVATVNKMDILYSWNMKHLANPNRMTKINEVNRKEGYSFTLRLITPGEV